MSRVGPEFWTDAREREFLEVRRRLGLPDGESAAEIDQAIATDFEDDPYELPDVRAFRLRAQLRR